MPDYSTVGTMPKEICCVNTLHLIKYIEQFYPSIPIERYLDGIINSKRFQVIDTRNGFFLPIDKEFLLTPSNWVSSELFGELMSRGRELTGDTMFNYSAGRQYFKMKEIGLRKTVLRLLDGRTIINNAPKENDKLNRTKTVEVVKNEKGHAIVRLHWKNRPSARYIEDACQNNRGVYEALGELIRNHVVVTETLCASQGAPYCEFDMIWRHKPFLKRIVALFKRWIARDLIEDLEEKENHNIELIRSQEDVIEKRTKELHDIQAKLLETQKRILENRITGGFAHEMRNALTGAQLEMKAVLDYREQGKAATEVIKEAATTLLKKIKDLQSVYQIPKDQIAQTLIPSIKEIAQVIEFLAGTHQDVYHDLERGLSITSQIRDYVKMAELKPGNEPVDVAALLKSYETKYAKDFGEQTIHYSVTGQDSLILRGDETHFNSIFSNLILNARDALLETEKEDKEIRISLESLEKDSRPFVQIKVQDNGTGIPENHLQEIFEPFFSTKPSSGTGLGLGIVKRLVQLYGGRIEVESKPGEGSLFIVTLPVKVMP
jgi:signal transduction histidine kinase